MNFLNVTFQRGWSSLAGIFCCLVFTTFFAFAETEYERTKRLLKAQRDLMRDVEITLESSETLNDSRKKLLTSMVATAYFENEFSTWGINGT